MSEGEGAQERSLPFAVSDRSPSPRQKHASDCDVRFRSKEPILWGHYGPQSANRVAYRDRRA